MGIGLGTAGQVPDGHGREWTGATGRFKARLSFLNHRTRRGLARLGWAGLCFAGPGAAFQGKALLGWAMQGVSVRGRAFRGKAWLSFFRSD